MRAGHRGGRQRWGASSSKLVGGLHQPISLQRLSALLVVGVGFFASAVTPARAVVITNLTTGAKVFQTDFEQGLSASPGFLEVGPDVSVTNSTTPPDPGASQGSNYLRLFRDSDTNAQGNAFARMSDSQRTSGDVVRFSTMAFLPDDGAAARMQMILDDGNFNSARAHVFSGGDGHVMAAVGPTFTPVDTGLTYTPGVWQEWDLQYAVGSPTFSVTVNGVTASGLLSHSVGQVSLGELFNGNHAPGTFYLDAVPPDAVPEPAAGVAGLALLGLMAGGRRRQGCRTR